MKKLILLFSTCVMFNFFTKAMEPAEQAEVKQPALVEAQLAPVQKAITVEEAIEYLQSFMQGKLISVSNLEQAIRNLRSLQAQFPEREYKLQEAINRLNATIGLLQGIKEATPIWQDLKIHKLQHKIEGAIKSTKKAFDLKYPDGKPQKEN